MTAHVMDTVAGGGTLDAIDIAELWRRIPPSSVLAPGAIIDAAALDAPAGRIALSYLMLRNRDPAHIAALFAAQGTLAGSGGKLLHGPAAIGEFYAGAARAEGRTFLASAMALLGEQECFLEFTTRQAGLIDSSTGAVGRFTVDKEQRITGLTLYFRS